MIRILSALFLLLLSINLVLNFDSAIVLVNSQVSAKNVLAENPIPTPTPKIKLPKDQGQSVPSTTASGVITKDLSTGKVLFEKNSHHKLPIASTTKIMTALVAAEHFKPDDILEVKDISLVSGSTMGLKLGEKITFKDLLYGMLLNSGNDAAFTIANNYPGGLSAFVVSMNKKSQQLNLQNTHFSNPAGFDDVNHFSSAFDLSVIAEEASKNQSILNVVGTKQSIVSSVDGSLIHNLKNINALLGVDGVIGFKTGYTPAARENLVTLIQRDHGRVLIVVLGSGDRFGETEKLIKWVDSNFIWE